MRIVMFYFRYVNSVFDLKFLCTLRAAQLSAAYMHVSGVGRHYLMAEATAHLVCDDILQCVVIYYSYR